MYVMCRYIKLLFFIKEELVHKIGRDLNYWTDALQGQISNSSSKIVYRKLFKVYSIVYRLIKMAIARTMIYTGPKGDLSHLERAGNLVKDNIFTRAPDGTTDGVELEIRINEWDGTFVDVIVRAPHRIERVEVPSGPRGVVLDMEPTSYLRGLRFSIGDQAYRLVLE